MTTAIDFVKQAQMDMFDKLAELLAAVDKAARLDPQIDREVPAFMWQRSDGVTFTYEQTSMHEIQFVLQVPADSVQALKDKREREDTDSAGESFPGDDGWQESGA